ncbi:hypothetical protein CK203_035818 [Vitis vinifera]|uniref:RING-type domain-containing protein n=1 Tax=Vitis vinifera TaxID=29760 RepID=A0A438FYZ8_VITVI|nr:hypothetical protein CK203_035818 [Vitis vinifera]
MCCLSMQDEEGEEISDLRCDHLFHKVCLDRWFQYKRSTSPVTGIVGGCAKPWPYACSKQQIIFGASMCQSHIDC